MYILVRLLKGFSKPLLYQIPENLDNQKFEGKIVNVPIKTLDTPALVLKTYKYLPPKINFKVRQINNLQKFPDDILFHNFLVKISAFYFLKPLYFYQRIRNFLLKEQNDERKILSNQDSNINEKQIILTEDQINVVNFIKNYINKDEYKPVLMHGVTGSGKTEIYKKLIIDAFKENKTTVLLLPEVSLAIQFECLLKKQLPKNIKIVGFHSACKISEKKELWQNLLDKKSILIIGVHLPIFLPIPNLGLIIVDEEHEAGFQEKKHPKINSKELAIWRAQFYKIPILLGSATPSLTSLYNVKKKNWNFFQLKKRFSGKFPKIELVFLKKDKRKSFWISKELENEIKNRLEKKEQTLIYLNRRGYSFFIQCKNCGFVLECPNCSVSLTLHQNGDSEVLKCHYCDFYQNIPKNCSNCKTECKNFIKKGIGTQQVVKILQNIFPNSKIARADLDTTRKKRVWSYIVENVERGNIDILVGTQVITKGYHFPKVTLVGILWADLNLHFPVFNSSETGLQKLIQVAGRAGRQINESKVIVQTINDHEIFEYINEENYIKFCENELHFRELTKYPPFFRLIQIELKNNNVAELENESNLIFKKLKKVEKQITSYIKILGPVKPIIYRVQKTETRHIFVKTSNFKDFYEILNKLKLKNFNSSLFITPTQ